VLAHAGWVGRLTHDEGLADALIRKDLAHPAISERDRAMLRSLRPPYNLRAWLGLITRRTCGKMARKKGLTAEPREVAAPAAPAPFGELLTKLPPADRLLLELFFVHDCSYEEIASILGISAESVGKQKTRALEKLKSLLE